MGSELERVRQRLNQERGLSAEVIRRTGLNPNTVWGIASGKTKNPGVKTLERIVRALAEIDGERPSFAEAGGVEGGS